MSRLPDRLPDRVDEDDANHLHVDGRPSIYGADWYASDADASTAPIRVGLVMLDRLRSWLYDRELGVLASVDRYRYLTTRQIELLHFHTHASPLTGTRICRRVLERLTKLRLLTRLQRRIGGVRAGSSGYVYGIGELGHRLLHEDGTSRGRWKEPSERFLDHTLAVAQLAVELTVRARRHPFEITVLETEPTSWRYFQKGLGGREVLKPDLFLALGLGEFEDRWFVEIDRGTASTTAVQRKCAVYLDYHRAGVEQTRHDVFPRVVWVAPHDRRASQLRQVVAGTRRAPADLFTVTTIDEAVGLLSGSAP